MGLAWAALYCIVMLCSSRKRVSCAAAWIYDRDPFQPLKWQDDLEAFKARLAAGEDVFGA